MTEPLYDYLEEIRRIYREVVAAADPIDGISLKEARQETMRILKPMVESEEIKIPLDDLLKTAIDRVDKADGDKADAALARIVAGQNALDLGDADPAFEVIARIAGRRKPWRRLTREDLITLDKQRYRNMRDAADAYDQWRPLYERGFGATLNYPTLGDAYDAGAFD